MTRKMKDSGIEWIGEIPEDWEVKRLKNLTTEINGGVWGTEAKGNKHDIPCMRIADFDRKNMTFKNTDFTIRNLDINKQKNYLLRKGDLLIEKSGGGEKQPVGFVVRYDLDISAIYTNFMAKISINHKFAESNFIKYLFASLYYTNINIKSIKQTTGLQNLDINSYLNEIIAAPSKSQQKSIAKFLDEKTKEIDNIISKTKKVIEEYKKYKQSLITETVTKGLDKNIPMKESGIEWIGKVPEHWRIAKINRITESYSGATPSRDNNKYWNNGNICWMSSGEVNKKIIFDTKEKITESGFDNSSVKYFPVNTVVVALNGQGKTKGKSAILKIKATVNQSLVGFISDENSLDYRYLNYCFITSYVFNRSYLAGGNKRDGISAKDLKRSEIPLPNIAAQSKISNFLDKKVSEIDNIIEIKEKLVKEMEAYKKSLIYETVTGKREVD